MKWRRPWLRRWTAVAAGAVLLLALQWWFGRPETWPRDTILTALRHVESSDRPNPPDGDGGLAIGPYQIHQGYWLDATAFDSTLGGSYQDCRQRAYAERVIDAYMRRHAAAAWATGHAETIARIHNGGPRGVTNPKTDGYWRRVRERLP
ncbi:MAG: hypothetical protein JNK49_02580 [Planctomycetes bacterium]|nr:hypothetical protein [Planctomycetota bacterium]